MITTKDSYEVPLFPLMRRPGFKSWRLVGLELWRPYFLVNYGCQQKWTWVTQSALLWQEEDLRTFCDQASKNSATKIYQIALMMPPEPTEIAVWNCLILREIWCCEIKSEASQGMLFVPVEGEHILSPNIPTHVSKFDFDKLIFRMEVT